MTTVRSMAADAARSRRVTKTSCKRYPSRYQRAPSDVCCSKDVDYLPSKAAVLLRATWDYVPAPILKLIRYIPVHPWTRIRNLNDLFREYGRQIIREQGPNMDTEKKVASKDIVSILSKCLQSPSVPSSTDTNWSA